VFLGAHYPSDVIVGMILGVAFAFIGNSIYDKTEDKSKLFTYVLLLLTPFVVFFMIKPDPLYADLYKLYGMLAGLILAVSFEERFASLDYTVAIWKKTLRVVIGVALALAVKEGFKALNVFTVLQLSFDFDAIKYIALVFVCLGLCPFLFKKLNI